MGLGDILAEAAYRKDPEANKHSASRFAKAIARHGVARSADFKRIERLPRRIWERQQLDVLSREMNAGLRTDGGTMTLRPVQVAALADFYEWRGLVGGIGVGGGKALVSLLAPHMVECERPLLFVPAQLRDQTERQVLPEMRQHWKIPGHLRIMGYEELSQVNNATFLEDYAPDLIIADEAQYLADVGSGRTRRVGRYMDLKPSTMFVALSGTLTRRSLRDYWHLMVWALKETMCPLPTTWRELQDWADALDEEIRDPGMRVSPGALKRFCEPREDVRSGYMRRLTETPGVIFTSDNAVDASLNIFVHKPTVPGDVASKLERLVTLWELPSGDYITEAVDLWRHAREISCGFWYQWNPKPPTAWLEARREWKRYVRDRITHNRKGLDTELQVWQEAAAEMVLPEFLAWVDVCDTFEPVTVPVWESDFLVDHVREFVGDADARGVIVWTEHDAFARRLQAATGWPFFGAGDDSIIDETGDRVVIASLRAHGTGKNLQFAFSKNIVVSCPPSGATWEQLLGRTHRPGQVADEVTVDVFLHTDAMRDAWERAQHDARYIEDTTGQKQKLNYATKVTR